MVEGVDGLFVAGLEGGDVGLAELGDCGELVELGGELGGEEFLVLELFHEFRGTSSCLGDLFLCRSHLPFEHPFHLLPLSQHFHPLLPHLPHLQPHDLHIILQLPHIHFLPLHLFLQPGNLSLQSLNLPLPLEDTLLVTGDQSLTLLDPLPKLPFSLREGLCELFEFELEDSVSVGEGGALEEELLEFLGLFLVGLLEGEQGGA